MKRQAKSSTDAPNRNSLAVLALGLADALDEWIYNGKWRLHPSRASVYLRFALHNRSLDEFRRRLRHQGRRDLVDDLDTCCQAFYQAASEFKESHQKPPRDEADELEYDRLQQEMVGYAGSISQWFRGFAEDENAASYAPPKAAPPLQPPPGAIVAKTDDAATSTEKLTGRKGRPAPPPEGARSVPMSLAELCRRYMNDQDARSDKVKPLLKKRGLCREAKGKHKWTICLDGLDAVYRERMTRATFP
jgi:hypothetical protein